MRHGRLPDGTEQPLYFPENHPQYPGWFKGMEVIIKERGFWPAAGTLRAECPGFKCEPGRTDCCCRRLLFSQPDFASQQSELEEYITFRGHICDFYPKYHCELNFIEQYWGAAKYIFRNGPRVSTESELEDKVRECLDRVPLSKIRK